MIQKHTNVPRSIVETYPRDPTARPLALLEKDGVAVVAIRLGRSGTRHVRLARWGDGPAHWHFIDVPLERIPELIDAIRSAATELNRGTAARPPYDEPKETR